MGLDRRLVRPSFSAMPRTSRSPPIAEVLGKSVNATTVLLHRARGSLRAAYATRVFARAGLPEECRGRKDAIVDLVEGRPVSDELRLHMASCSPCQQSAEELRGMTRAFAIAPMFMVPAALGAKVAAAVSMAAGATAVTAAAGGAGATIATASTATTASGAAVGTGATAASGAAVGTGATAASGAGLATGVTAGAGAAASGGILATVGQVAVAGLITVALVGTMALAPGRVGGGGAPATGHPATAVAAAPRLMASTAGRGSTMDGSSVSGVAPSTAVGRPGATPTAPRAGAGTITNPVTAPGILSPPVAATAPPAGPAAPPAGPAATPRQASPPATASTPVPTPNLAANRVRWSVGTSCAARAGLFHPGDVLWVSVRRALPGAVIRWVLTGTRAARPAGLRVAGTVTAGSDGTACAAIWTIPARMDATGVFRLDVAGSRRTIVLKSR